MKTVICEECNGKGVVYYLEPTGESVLGVCESCDGFSSWIVFEGGQKEEE